MTYDSLAADRDLIAILRKRSRAVVCDASGILFRQGDTPEGIHLLESGEAVLAMVSHTGETVLCVHAGPGSLLGLPALLADEPYTLTAQIREGSKVRLIARTDFNDLIKKDAVSCRKVLTLVAAEVGEARRAFFRA
jgi:CRP-like cAMP-binding protein